MKKFFALMLMALAWIAPVAAIANQIGTVQLTTSELPIHFDAGPQNVTYYELPSGWQTLTLTFRSNGFFTNSPGAHIFISLQNSDHHSWIDGQGVIIGNVSEAPGGCPGTSVMEVERYFQGGMYLYSDSCSAPLKDNTPYRIVIHNSYDFSGLSYWIYHDGMLVSHATSGEFARDGHGLWIGYVFGDPDTKWSIDFSDIRMSVDP